MDKSHKVVVDNGLCIGCELCAKDCVTEDIKIRNGKAVPDNKYCITCGHCEAICPKAAISITGFKDESIPYDLQTRLDHDTLLNAIKTRRSIRSFNNEPITDDIRDMIIQAGRYAPTGCNYQDTTFYVLGSKQRELESIARDVFLNISKVSKHFIPFLKNMTIDESFFFKGAPLVIVLTGNKVNASLAAQNMAFMAEAYGLGVLFSGFFTTVVNYSSKIRSIIGIKHGAKAVTTLVIGYPSVKYYRTAKREEAKVVIL